MNIENKPYKVGVRFNELEGRWDVIAQIGNMTKEEAHEVAGGLAELLAGETGTKETVQ